MVQIKSEYKYANYVQYSGGWQNPVAQDQSGDRTLRAGQTQLHWQGQSSFNVQRADQTLSHKVNQGLMCRGLTKLCHTKLSRLTPEG